MRMAYVVHIIGGSLALLSGYIALYATKGGPLHRRIGMVFVVAMVTMCTGGMVLAAVRGGPWGGVNFRAGLLTTYLVITALTTVRPLAVGARPLHVAGLLAALGVGIVSLTFGIEAIANGGRRNGIPAFPFFLFAFVGLAGAAGDLRVLRYGPFRGTERLTRHLWRMTFALLIAAMSFFFGQAKVIPKPIRIPGLLAIPVLAVLATMLYWLWRVRFRRSFRGIVKVGTPKTA
jgi:uncharacterized membrane protein